MLQPHSVTLTHIPTHSYSCTCSLAKPTSLDPACTSPSVSVLGGLGCRLLYYWTELSGKYPTIGCCQLVKFFCYHGCRVSCPKVSQCIWWRWWNCVMLKKNPPSDGSHGCSGTAPKSLSTDACKRAHMAPLHLQQERGWDRSPGLWSRWNSTAKHILYDGCTDEPELHWLIRKNRIINLECNVWVFSPGLASYVLSSKTVLLFAQAKGTKIEWKHATPSKTRWKMAMIEITTAGVSAP